MKTIISLLALLVLLNYSLPAQEETLLEHGKITHGGFGAPVIKFTQINNEFGVLVGGRGGWIINNTFVLGFGGYGLVNNIEADDFFFGERPFLNFGYGGLELEYIMHSDQVAHFTVYTMFGGGAVTFRDELWNDFEDWDDWDFGNDTFFIFEPAVNAELNITSFFRLNAGIGYRLVTGVDFESLTNEDLSGVSATLTLKFGKF